MQKPTTKKRTKARIRVRDLYEQPCINAPLVEALSQEMLSDDTIAELALIFEILACPARLKIIHALSSNELCVCGLSRVVRMSESAVSHQLRLLRSHCLFKYRYEGKGDEFIQQFLEDAVQHM
ncbi:MAG TPA: metalloregulator ArsR/SmtB family transcription factor [Thermodesulfobacteriota bacterium]|nr:metalloregulator ArsR/SmtB family transcription factor [Thermodesulfobacteriota bacterium]